MDTNNIASSLSLFVLIFLVFFNLGEYFVVLLHNLFARISSLKVKEK